MVDLTIVFPVHNEASTIGELIRQTRDVLHDLDISYEILCVENGSTDQSLDKLSELSGRFPEIRVLRSKIGWGNAVRLGMKQANGKLFCYMVSDGQIDPRWLVTLYKRFKKERVALVKVWRTSREDRIRFFVSQCYNMLAAAWFGLPSRDINATPKILRTELIRQLKLREKNIGLDLEILIQLKQRAMSWLEIPAPSHKRTFGTSTTKVKTVWEMIAAMSRLALRHKF